MAKSDSQLTLPFKGPHGGRRRGAGRPNRSGLQGHLARPTLSPRVPVHVTLKLALGVPSLRRKQVFRCFRDAVRTARARGFAVAHFAIISNHVHLILEPPAKGVGSLIQSFCISFARRLNGEFNRKGAVFLDRYHMHVLKTPTEVRHALDYVLTNEARHRTRGKRPAAIARRLEIQMDPFSSAYSFQDWKALFGSSVEWRVSAWSEDLIEAWHAEILTPARHWLLRKGWMRGMIRVEAKGR